MEDWRLMSCSLGQAAWGARGDAFCVLPHHL